MKRTQSFSLYAFFIAVLIHLVVALLLILVDRYSPSTEKRAEPIEPKEERFRLSLQEHPDVPQEAIVKNDIPTPPVSRPIPKGEQMIEKVHSPKPQKAPAVSGEKPLSKPAEPIRVTEPDPEPKKGYERHTAKPVATIERKPLPKKEPGLYDILSKADGSVQETGPKSSTKISDSIQRLYGDKFNELSEGEQKYILDNQEVMRRITQGVLDRYGRSRIPDNIRTNDVNMIEFYLHPDGSISDIRFLKNSRLSILDDTTKEVIELAYSKYPRPGQKTLIRYRVFYNLTGY